MTREEKRRHVGALLKKARGKRRQRDLAALSGVDRSALSGLENGRIGLGKDRAQRLAAAYGIDYAELEPYITERGNRYNGESEQVPRGLQEELAGAVQTLAEVAPQLSTAVRQLQELLDEQRAAEAPDKPRQSE